MSEKKNKESHVPVTWTSVLGGTVLPARAFWRQMSPSSCTVQLIQHRCGRSIRGVPGLLHGPTVLRQPFFSIAPADSQSRGSPPFSGDGRSPCGPTRQRKPLALRQCADPNLGADPSVGSAHDPHLQTFSSVLVPTMAPVGKPYGNHPRGS